MSKRIRRLWLSLAIVLNVACVCVGTSTLHVRASEALDAPGQKTHRQAILIGIGDYKKTAPLPCAANDVRQLAMTLRERGEYEVLEIVDTARVGDSQSESQAIQAKVRDCLAKLRPQDDVLVYFSCHGFRDKKGKLYLAQIDCDPTNPAPGGIPVSWLREQLAACRAKFKLLVIDACHGGSEKGEDAVGGVAAKDLAIPFRDLASVVTLASSQGNEQSLIWHEKRQSLFTYWVNQALKGHADQNGDSQVTIDELYDYVFQNVTDVAERHFGRKQTPVRIVRSGTLGVPVVISLNPHTLKGMIEDMAEQLATAMQLRGLKKVGIPEFTVDTGPRELLGGKFGTLGRYCAAELEARLMKKSGDKFVVVQHDALQDVLATKGIGVKDLQTDAVRDLSVREEKIPVLAMGTLRSRNGRVITAQCKLVGLEGQRTFGTAGGTASLNGSEWAMLGRSTGVLIPGAPTVDHPTPDPIESMDRESQGTHPCLNPNFPFPVQIMVGKEERKGVFRGNDMFVPLREGEIYWIRIQNRETAPVLMRLLVDGRNTLPEKVRTKNVTVERVETPTTEPKHQPEHEQAVEPKAEEEMGKPKDQPREEQVDKPTDGPVVELPAQRVNLAEARYWWLDPDGTFGIRGFFSKLGKDGTYLEFKVAGAPNSLSARENFGEQLGLVTVAFYAPKGGARGLMTEPGKEGKQKLRMYKAIPVGNLLAVVNIHYVTPEAINRLLEEKKPPIIQ